MKMVQQSATGEVRVALCITCLPDLFFPEIGEAVVKVLRRLGVQLDFPPGQTCCGQPAFNTGYTREAAHLARRFINIFEGFDSVVMPSGSCATMVKLEYPHLFAHDPDLRARAEALSRRTFEFTQFLVDVLGVEDVGATYQGTVTYHDACHACRGLGVRDQPRRLLRAVRGLDVVEMERSDACCGFGGTFAVRMSDISDGILEVKRKHIVATGAEAVVTTDAGCMMQIGGGLGRHGQHVQVLHIAEVLAGETSLSARGGP